MEIQCLNNKGNFFRHVQFFSDDHFFGCIQCLGS